MTHEERLSGGFINEVVRIGDTVHRRGTLNTGFTGRLLRHLEERGWDGAPRFLGVDAQGGEVLSYIAGIVPGAGELPAGIMSDASLERVARMVRELHDLTAGTELAGDEEVVCHNDLSPRNTVYREEKGALLPVALIDWDIAAPGPRIHDVAHMCWQYLALGPNVADLRECARTLRLLCDAYGLGDRADLIDTILWWQDATAAGIDRGADEGMPAMIGLRDAGVPDEVRRSAAWVRDHRASLEGAL